MKTRNQMFAVTDPLATGSEVGKDLILLDVGPLSLPDWDAEATLADPSPETRKDSGEAHLDYLKVSMTMQGYERSGGDTFVDVASNRITGTDESETLYGTDLRDVIEAGRGNDSVYAGAGNDAVDGGNGHDWIELGDGDDIAFGGKGDDTILGGTGNDLLSGGPGNDFLHAGDDGWLNILNGGRDIDIMQGSDFDGVTDVFQYTEAEDAPATGNPNVMDKIRAFNDGEDLIWLVFDANPFAPGEQEFQFVSEEDAGTAGTIWLEQSHAFDFGGQAMVQVIVHGHTDNDGAEDFSINVDVWMDSDDVDLDAPDAAYQALSADDFIFG